MYAAISFHDSRRSSGARSPWDEPGDGDSVMVVGSAPAPRPPGPPILAPAAMAIDGIQRHSRQMAEMPHLAACSLHMRPLSCALASPCTRKEDDVRRAILTTLVLGALIAGAIAYTATVYAT